MAVTVPDTMIIWNTNLVLSQSYFVGSNIENYWLVRQYAENNPQNQPSSHAPETVKVFKIRVEF